MTIVYVEGFEHKNTDNTLLFDSTHGIWGFAEGQSQITFPAGRTGVSCKMVYDGVSGRRLKTVDLATATDHMVGALYFRIPSAPSVESIMFEILNTGAAQNMGRWRINTDGTIEALISGGTVVGGPGVSNNAWHRLDWHIDSSATTWTLSWAIDGSDQTNATLAGQTAGMDCTQLVYGTGTTAHTLTVEFDDVVVSDASADYKINGGAAYNVGYLIASGDGTHNAGTNIIEDQAGTDITSPNAFPLINEIPVETADYIQQIATGAGNYAEVTFNSTGETNILGVCCACFGGSVQAQNPNGTTRFVDSGGTTLVDVFSGNMGNGSTIMRGVILRIPDPGSDGWTQSELNSIKLRVGFSTSASGTATPRWVLGMVQYAYGADIGAQPFGIAGFLGA